MDLRSCKLRWAAGHVRAVVVDAGGERGRDLEGAAAARVLAAAEPLRVALAAGADALSIDVGDRVVRASVPGVRADGARFVALEAEVREVARAILNELLPSRAADEPATPSDPAFWSMIWQTGRDGWELGRAAPPLARWVAAHPARRARALVVGCGRGHEVRMLAQAVAAEVVVGVDFAPEAIEAARALTADGTEAAAGAGAAGAGAAGAGAAAGSRIEFRQADVFTLAAAPERYDLALEHTCFCAIAPERRAEYARVMQAVLVPGGRLVGLFWQHGRAGGPPFSVTRDEVEQLFVAAGFAVAGVEKAPDSVASRAGQEWLIELVRE
ncbi:MAG: methyltransferase domain-containing protein [Deltaproteobacteria bacterium]|nr:methyltransferase domain-containing protein [Deltaproteobacteria bacterium]